jgi:carboxypeptidase Q
MRTLPIALATLLLTTTAPLAAKPAATKADDKTQVMRVIDEGTNHSQVMQTAQHLTDVIGSRMTNSPGMRKAEEWTQQKFREWKLINVHKEGFQFGRGWWIESVQCAHGHAAPAGQLTAIPVAWTPPTRGTSPPIVVAPIRHVRDLAQYKGKLAGKIVLVSYPGEAPKDDTTHLQALTRPRIWASCRPTTSRATIRTSRDLIKDTSASRARSTASWRRKARWPMVKMSYRSGGKLVQGEGYLPPQGRDGRAARRRDRGRGLSPPRAPGEGRRGAELEIEQQCPFRRQRPKAYNIIADIPGSDPQAGYVMAGAHLDSWVAGDGAADNGAGSVVVMEAARILPQMGVKPKRTIRFALWAGEEQGLYGSIAYIEKNLARRPTPATPDGAPEIYYNWATRFPITPQPGHKLLSAYFNLDNGSGKVRGIYAENNMAAVPIFREWLAPFASMGASTVAIQKTEGTDHQFMQTVGVPGFQFIQDPLDYGTRLHHTQLDTFDHLKAEDMRQGAIILASFLLNAANADEPFPRGPIPTQPDVTNPFAYPDPDGGQ